MEELIEVITLHKLDTNREPVVAIEIRDGTWEPLPANLSRLQCISVLQAGMLNECFVVEGLETAIQPFRPRPTVPGSAALWLMAI